MVAYDLGIQFRLRRAVEGKTFSSLTSGEGFVFDFFGPGRLMLQSRNPSALTSWIQQNAPGQNPTGSSGSALGGLGNLLGNWPGAEPVEARDRIRLDRPKGGRTVSR